MIAIAMVMILEMFFILIYLFLFDDTSIAHGYWIVNSHFAQMWWHSFGYFDNCALWRSFGEKFVQTADFYKTRLATTASEPSNVCRGVCAGWGLAFRKRARVRLVYSQRINELELYRVGAYFGKKFFFICVFSFAWSKRNLNQFSISKYGLKQQINF